MPKTLDSLAPISRNDTNEKTKREREKRERVSERERERERERDSILFIFCVPYATVTCLALSLYKTPHKCFEA